MKKLLAPIFVIFFITILLFAENTKAQNNDCSKPDDLNPSAIEKCLADIKNALDMSVKATKPLESQLNSIQTQINGIKNRVKTIENDIAIKKENIGEGYKNLEKQQEILNATVRNYYIKSYYNSPLLTLLSTSSASEITQALAYQKAATDQDKVIITNIAISISDLETKKQNLENEQTKLISIKASLDEESAKLDKIVSGAKVYQGTLSGQIAALSAKQQEILGQRLAGLNIPRSAGTAAPACVDDREKDPGFGPRLAFFTYGVPNRTGLNQYGAWGRAKAGQNADTILHAYYNFDGYQNMDATIKVNDGNGYNTGNIIWTGSLEEYVKRIWEVPDSWTDNDLAVLKAQAIAARSFVLAETDNGNKSICANTYCQVFQTNPKGGNWESAVNQTANQVMVQGGKPIIAWFSSTHGGYILSSSEIGWSGASWTKHATDTTTNSAGSFGDLHSNSYDRDSPWFYCDWGSRSQYNKTAWLKPDEVADIVNVIMLARSDSSVNEHLYQTDKPNPAGTDTWDANRIKTELQKREITPFHSISGISVDVNWSGGRVTTVHVDGDSSDPNIPGDFFKTYFNLRAPANIQIVGPLFNVEKR